MEENKHEYGDDDIDRDEDEGGVCELDVDWDGMYQGIRTNILKFLQENKLGKVEKTAKNARNIPLDERVKIVNSKYEAIGKIKAIPEEEAVRKYVKDEEYQKKCLKILMDIREGNIDIEERDGYCSGEQWSVENEKRNDPLLKAVKQAIEENDLGSLKSLSKGCFLPSNRSIYSDLDRCMNSLFEYACKVYADDCALYLLEEGGGIKQRFENNETPLIQALRVGNEGVCKFLIERGADCKVRSSNGHTALHSASFGNCIEIAKMLIEKGADIEAMEEEGVTPLHLAAYCNSADVAKLLIERGAYIDMEDINGETPLHWTIKKNSDKVTKLLIERGADIEAKDINGKTPLHLAAAYWNSYEVAKLLIERGVNIEVKDENGKTPLHEAVWNNSFDITKLLIEKGADIEAKDEDGRTPLHLAAYLNRCEVAKLLIDRGANVEAKDKCGQTPLQKVRNYQMEKLLKKL